MKEIPIYEKSSNQPIAAGVVGALLLVSCVAFYVLFRSGSRCGVWVLRCIMLQSRILNLSRSIIQPSLNPAQLRKSIIIK
ncbi:hypothetical protein [Wolbachia endosymbiont (group B) of Idaea aversata]|uniref:hypothetical protein n=1 Tax=Wolbachia endosymbiont (group B) of Idaea aversata TaxID=2954020 RepID=UPI00221EF54A|nr:hypothetical protein [Wolbachia endosymbiont (group B) of Idaea aversata]